MDMAKGRVLMALISIISGWAVFGYSDEEKIDSSASEGQIEQSGEIQGLDKDYGYAPGANGPAEPS